MPSEDDKNSSSKLPVILKPIDFEYIKPERRNELADPKKYDKIDSNVRGLVMLGSNGITYVPENAFPAIFDTTKANAAFIFENQISEVDRRDFNGQSYAHSSAVVGLADKKCQEVRDAEKQAILQYSRDSLINISDSPEAQNIRRKVDSFTNKMLPKLRDARGIDTDEVTGEKSKKGFAFHHVNPKALHTDPEGVLDPTKGRNLNPDTHADVHRKNINNEEQFKKYQEENKPK